MGIIKEIQNYRRNKKEIKEIEAQIEWYRKETEAIKERGRQEDAIMRKYIPDWK